MAQQKLDLFLRGLYTSPNFLSGVPQGALDIADNIVINAKNVADSRRGQGQFADLLDIGDGQVNKLFNYVSALIASYDNKLAYTPDVDVIEQGNEWNEYDGTYEQPSPEYKMRSLEAMKNFYFTTSAGIYKIDNVEANPRKAGVPRALSGTGVTTGSSGFLITDSAVAYRMVWGYKDANNNLIIGSPSQRLVVSNSTGGARDVELTFAIPDSITTEYFYQIYRSLGVSPATAEPTDELQLVLQGNPSSGEITAKEFTVLDQTPYSLMRATLYTSPSLEGIENANDEPPLAMDMDVFKGSAFYANIRQKQRLTLALISVDSPSLGFVTETGDISNGSDVITGLASTAGLKEGMRVVGVGIPDGTTIDIVDPTEVTLSAAAVATDTGVSFEFQDRFTVGGVDYWAGSTQDANSNTFLVDSSGTPGQNIAATAINLVQVINTSPTNTFLYAYYISGVNDLPGQILFEERAIGGATFYATSTAGGSFSPTLFESGTDNGSDNDARQNRVAISKPGLVEAVPLYAFFDIGSANFPIERVVALRDGIFFFKSDGIFRLSGESFDSYTVNLVDNTVALNAPESAVPFNNQIFCSTTQGICAVTDSGVQIMSVPIEDALFRLSATAFYEDSAYRKKSFGVAYESARLYLFFTVDESPSDPVNPYVEQAFVYNSLTDSWTRWPIARSCGVLNQATDLLFFGQPNSGQALRERKRFDSSDYIDELYFLEPVSIDSPTQMTVTDASDIRAGMVLDQRFGAIHYMARVLSVDGNIITHEAETFENSLLVAVQPIENTLSWVPIDVENPGILKQFSELSLFFKDAAFNQIDAAFATNISPNWETVPLLNTSATFPWGGFQWGQGGWGGEIGGPAVIRTYGPREKQRGHWLRLKLSLNEPFQSISLQGLSLIYNNMSSRFK